MSTLLSPDGTVATLAEIATAAEEVLFQEDAGAFDYGTGGPIEAAEAEFHRKGNAAKRDEGSLTFLDLLLEETHEALATTNVSDLRSHLVSTSAVLLAWIAVIDVRDGEWR